MNKHRALHLVNMPSIFQDGQMQLVGNPQPRFLQEPDLAPLVPSISSIGSYCSTSLLKWQEIDRVHHLKACGSCLAWGFYAKLHNPLISDADDRKCLASARTRCDIRPYMGSIIH
jgi:hypothetical protein